MGINYITKGPQICKLMTLFILASAFTILNGCKDDPPNIPDCPTYFDFEFPQDTIHFFDFGKKPTIQYKRTTDQGIDTVSFEIYESDSGYKRYVTGHSDGGGGCYRWSDNFQFISHKYYSEGDNSLIWVHLEEDHDVFGITANLYFKINQITFPYTIGGAAGIGNSNATNFVLDVDANGKTYYSNWKNRGAYKVWFYPQKPISVTPDKGNAQAFYNPDHGIVKMEFNNGTEIWELIP